MLLLLDAKQVWWLWGSLIESASLGLGIRKEYRWSKRKGLKGVWELSQGTGAIPSGNLPGNRGGVAGEAAAIRLLQD